MIETSSHLDNFKRHWSYQGLNQKPANGQRRRKASRPLCFGPSEFPLLIVSRVLTTHNFCLGSWFQRIGIFCPVSEIRVFFTTPYISVKNLKHSLASPKDVLFLTFKSETTFTSSQHIFLFKLIFLPFIHTSFIRMRSAGLERQEGIKSLDWFVNSWKCAFAIWLGDLSFKMEPEPIKKLKWYLNMAKRVCFS